MGGKSGGDIDSTRASPFTGDNSQNVDILAREMASVGSPTGPSAGIQWMMSGGGAGAATNQAQQQAPAGAEGPAFGLTDVADPAGPQGTGSQTNQQQAPQQQQQPQQQDTGASLAQSVTVPLAWQEAMKKKPQPSDGSVDIHGQV
jgi:hypothetical protein